MNSNSNNNNIPMINHPYKTAKRLETICKRYFAASTTRGNIEENNRYIFKNRLSGYLSS